MDESKTALIWLETLASEKQFFKDKKLPTLAAVNAALDALGRPDKTFKHRVIVGGTAGKGTVCRYVEQTLLEAGTTVALISSPHLQVVNERIRLNGRLISAKDFTTYVLRIKAVAEQGIALTYYEAVVLAGILAAAEAGVEILICEVGLGGALDAVNAVAGSRIAAVTFIGDDHREILGPNLSDIAKTKAGIFTDDSILNLTYEQNFCSIFEEVSKSKIVYIKGIRQKLNKKLARNICEQILGSNEFFMAKPKLPARWEAVSKYQRNGGVEKEVKIILEGAHSVPRFEYLVETKLKKQSGPYTLILGMRTNHDAQAFKILQPYAQRIIWTQAGSGAQPAEKLKERLGVGEVVKKPLEALKIAQQYGEPILVTGSFYLCGAIREQFYPSGAMVEQQSEWPE